MYGRELRAVRRLRESRKAGRLRLRPRRCLQAPHLPILLPGTGRGGSQDTLRSLRGPWPEGRHRGDGPLRHRDGHGARADIADRRPQHGQLLPAQARRQGDSRHGSRRRPQEGALGDGRGVAASGRGRRPDGGEPPRAAGGVVRRGAGAPCRGPNGYEGRVATFRQCHGQGGYLVSGMGLGRSVGRLGDRFVLVRELGSGGMSRVFLGRDEVLDRPVALKIVEADPEDPEIGLRFQREGRSAARLSHPNIVRVFDAGEDELDGRGVSYIVMEYVPGGDFEDLIDRNGPIPETMLLRIGADVASGLTHAHERGIIHRDIKPHNILLDERGSPKLADFGIARALDGTYLGTVAYASPEQLRGQRVTPKSDVYSFGATLYHAAVGEQPFSGNSIEVANQHVLKVPAPPRERGAQISERLETLILGCLAKKPSERPDAACLHDGLLQNGAAEATAALAAPAARAPGGGF